MLQETTATKRAPAGAASSVGPRRSLDIRALPILEQPVGLVARYGRQEPVDVVLALGLLRRLHLEEVHVAHQAAVLAQALQQLLGINELPPLTVASTCRRDAENERSHHALKLLTSCLSRDRLSMPLESKMPFRLWCPLPGMFRLWCRKWPTSCATTPMNASP